MPLNLRFRPELIAADAWLAPTCVVLGDVTIGARCGIWYQTVIRGDTERIVLGEETNVQDLCMLHADPGFPCLIGRRVTIGHRAIVHGARIEDDVMIGMGAILLNGCKIGTGSVIAAGSLIPEGAEIPPGSLVMGSPGRVKREVSAREIERIKHAADHYVLAAAECRAHAQGEPQ